MSAFFVGNLQISRLANDLHRMAADLDRSLAERMPEKPEALAKAMHGLNVEALVSRYPENVSEMVEPYRYEAAATFGTNTIQLYQSIRCYLYQCSEGDIPESKLFKLLSNLGKALAVEIADRAASASGARWE